jgi:4-hydroxy-4-methyl-2-oxoglutarate aldolase
MTSDVELLHQLASLPASTICEANEGLGALAPTIRSIRPGMRVAGPAFTVKIFPGDNLAVLHANGLAQPGDVLVIDAGRTDDTMVVWGASSTIAAQMRGIAGVVTNGAVRDLDEMIKVGLPIFAAGVCLRANAKNHPGWLNIPVTVGDVVIAPGDFVIGDSDGVVVVQKDRLFEVLRKALVQREAEKERDRRIRSGESIQTAMGRPARK